MPPTPIKAAVRSRPAYEVFREALARLDVDQRRVVDYDDGKLVVTAIPGSGKTFVMVVRAARLSRRGKSVLTFTFAKEAANELERRLTELGARGHSATIHSVALNVVQDLTGCTVDEGAKRRTLLRDLIDDEASGTWFAPIDKFMALAKARYTGAESWPHDLWPLAQQISDAARSARNEMGLRPPSPDLLMELLPKFEQLRRAARLVGFDDMVPDALAALASSEAARRTWSSRWAYVQLDECQDATPGQVALAEILAGRGNLVVCGDGSQNLYAFRGCDPTMIDALKIGRGYEVASLEWNYRAGTMLCGHATSMLAFAGSALTVRPTRANAGQAHSLVVGSAEDEADALGDEVQRLQALGTPLRKIAVLYRVNAQARLPEGILLSRGIPCRMLRGRSFWDLGDVRDLLSYLLLADSAQPVKDCSEAVRRVYNRPSRGLGAKFLSTLETCARRAGKDLAAYCRAPEGDDPLMRWSRGWLNLQSTLRALEEAKAMPPGLVLSQLLASMRWVERIRLRDPDDVSADAASVLAVTELQRLAAGFGTVHEMLEYIEAVRRAAKAVRGDAVSLSTVHTMKGREAEHIFLLGAVEGILPARRCDLAEERRIFYVALTRARESFLAFCPREHAFASPRRGEKELCPTRFLSEARIPDRAVQQLVADSRFEQIGQKLRRRRAAADGGADEPEFREKFADEKAAERGEP